MSGSLDDEILLPVLERVHRGAIEVKCDEYGRPWYYDNGRQCLFATRLFETLVELNYLRWDSLVGEPTKLRVRQDGIWEVRLDDTAFGDLRVITGAGWECRLDW